MFGEIKRYKSPIRIRIRMMRSSKKKSSATEGKRKTRMSDEARAFNKKPVSKKKTVSVDNDGSHICMYLRQVQCL